MDLFGYVSDVISVYSDVFAFGFGIMIFGSLATRLIDLTRLRER